MFEDLKKNFYIRYWILFSDFIEKEDLYLFNKIGNHISLKIDNKYDKDRTEEEVNVN